MSERKVCDFCNKDISFQLREFYFKYRGINYFEWKGDLCNVCGRELEKYIIHKEKELSKKEEKE